MSRPDRIHLRDYIISADIGAFQSERGQQQRLRFTITVELAQSVGGVDDQVDAILSYDVLTEAVATALADQRYNLVETLAEKIAAEILVHPRAASAEVTVEKLDRGPFALGVTITRDAARVEASAPAPGARVLLYLTDRHLPEGPFIIVPPTPDLPLPVARDTRRIALLALDQSAWALAERLGLEVAESRAELQHAISQRGTVVWAPARLGGEAGVPAEPAALAFWLAERLDAARLFIALPTPAPLPTAPETFSIPVERLP